MSSFFESLFPNKKSERQSLFGPLLSGKNPLNPLSEFDFLSQPLAEREEKTEVIRVNKSVEPKLVFLMIALWEKAQQHNKKKGFSLDAVMTALNHIYDENAVVSRSDEDVFRSLFPATINGRTQGKDFLLEKTTLWACLRKFQLADRCFCKKSNLTDLFMNLFQNDGKIFNHFIMSENKYLTQKYTDKTVGLHYLLSNEFFVERLIQKTTPDIWSEQVVLGLACNVFEKKFPIKMTELFVQKIEKAHPNVADDVAMVFLSVFRKKNNFFWHVLDMKHILAVMKSAKKPQLKQRLASVLGHCDPQLFKKMLYEVSSDDDIAVLTDYLSQTAAGQSRAFHIAVSDMRNITWYLSEKKKMSSACAEKMIRAALINKKHSFLMQPKQMRLSKEFPCYAELCQYFQNQPTQAVRFLESFCWDGVDSAVFFDYVSDFLPNKKYQAYFIRKTHVLHEWAKLKGTHKIVNLFFGKNAEDEIAPVCAFTPKAVLQCWTEPDENGATPWHYLCQDKNKIFFRRNLKALHPAFLAVCSVRDNDGKTPLDYAATDLKFIQYIAEKIPNVVPEMEKQGISLKHVTVVKKVEPVKPEQKVAETVVKTVAQKKQWNIVYRGHDAEWKKDAFIELLQEEIDKFPEPCSSEMRERQNREMKPRNYSVAAFRTVWSGKAWRVPYITNGETIYIFPSRERDHAYDDDHAEYIRSLAKQLKRELDEPRCVANQKNIKEQKGFVYIRS